MSKHRSYTRSIRRAAAATVLAAVVLGTQLASTDSAAAPAAPTPQATTAGQAVPVTVVDNASHAWAGVPEAIAGWNVSPLVNITLADACTPGAFCVVVDAFDHRAQWAGLTTYLAPDLAHVQLDLAALELYPTDADQASVVCHELGHVLGVEHPAPDAPDVAGCIAAPDPGRTTAQASEADLAGLEHPNGWGALDQGTAWGL